MKWHDMQKWQKKRLSIAFLTVLLVCTAYVSIAVISMMDEHSSIASAYDNTFKNADESLSLKESLGKDAVKVSSGTYVETLKEISLKNCNFRVSFIVWFKWTGNDDLDFTDNGFRIYNGVINKSEVMANSSENGIHYQELRVDATVSKSFNTSCFPLGSQVLKFYIEPNQYTVDEVIFEPDYENSGVNRNLSISGYDLVQHGIAEHVITYPNTMNYPGSERPRTTSEIVTVLEVSRSDLGLYVKCFIALIGTTVWILITLYVCANHAVNPLGTVPAALFGTIGNFMVGANLLPDVVEVGLVEFVNIYGTLIIFMGIISIICVNRIRETGGGKGFAKTFGRVMFYTILILCLAGQIAMPLAAYRW